MSEDQRNLFVRVIERLLGKIRFPYLFVLVLALFGVTMAVPDPLPFVDEILLGAMTILFGVWRRRREERLTGDEGSASAGEADLAGRRERSALPSADER
jgi:hypothetical protein